MSTHAIVCLSLALLLCGCEPKVSTSSQEASGTITNAPPASPHQQNLEHRTSSKKRSAKDMAAKIKEEPQSNTSDQGSARTFTEGSIEYKIAVIDAGAPVDVNGPEVQRVSTAMDILGKKVKQSRTEMADECVAAHNAMVKRGVTDE